jgi:hypothetical protein
MHDLLSKFGADDTLAGTSSGDDPNVVYLAQLKALTAERWLRSD